MNCREEHSVEFQEALFFIKPMLVSSCLGDFDHHRDDPLAFLTHLFVSTML